MNQPTSGQASQKGFFGRTFERFNTFKVGLITGLSVSVMLVGGASHLLFNVFKFGAVTIGDHTFGQVGSPSTQTDSTEISGNGSLNQDTIEANGSGNIQGQDSEINVDTSSEGVSTGGDITAGDGSTITINVNSNEELPGFNPRQGYRSTPPDISEFNDALLIKDVSFGGDNVGFETREIFIKRRKYTSTFNLKASDTQAKRVGFSLQSAPSPKGIFLQFGLGDYASGESTMTYFVSIFGDGNALWSGQVKYGESQIVSVVLDIEDYSDVLIEYQVVEAGGVYPSENPLFFTEASLLF